MVQQIEPSVWLLRHNSCRCRLYAPPRSVRFRRLRGDLRWIDPGHIRAGGACQPAPAASTPTPSSPAAPTTRTTTTPCGRPFSRGLTVTPAASFARGGGGGGGISTLRCRARIHSISLSR